MVIHNKAYIEPRPDDIKYHLDGDPNRQASALSDIILGGQDGLVNVLGVILGGAAATEDTRIIIAAGLAAMFAESISMGAVAYTSTLANDDLYLSARIVSFMVSLLPGIEHGH